MAVEDEFLGEVVGFEMRGRRESLTWTTWRRVLLVLLGFGCASMWYAPHVLGWISVVATFFMAFIVPSPRTMRALRERDERLSLHEAG
jgi:hypothetical protein